jgi:hypothetical protein
MFNWLKCKFGLCNYVYENDYADGYTRYVFGKIYKCSRCGDRKWVTYDGRVYFR